MTTALGLRDLNKRYGATVALSDVTFDIPSGTIHAILGENGAGKSTLVKILSGVVQPDAGSVEITGKPTRLGSVAAARRAGIATVFQELSLIPDLTVAENVLIDNAPRTRFGWFSGQRQAAEARKWLAKVGVEGNSLSTPVKDLSLPGRQMVEIAKALAREPRILILDEATASLNAEAVASFFTLLRGLKADGLTMIFISHRINEIDQIADDISILRNGEHIDTFPSGSRNHDEICSLIAGREVSQLFPKRPHGAERFEDRPVVLRVANLETPPRLMGVSFDLHAGEVLGIGGLEGHGQKDLLMTLFGTIKPKSGTVELAGQFFRPKSPFDAVAHPGRMLLLPEDRKTDGLLLIESISKNILLGVMARISRLFRNRSREDDITTEMFQRLSIKAGAPDHAVRTLSGGNQQKVLLSRLLALEPGVLLLVDPTRGIDVGTKQELYHLIRELGENGVATLFLTSDYEELIGLCDRVLILFEGRLVAELSGDMLTQEKVIAASLGLTPEAMADAA